ncbi:MAG TPA: hypothetical protein VHC70_00750 [Phycisphaerales bacterium]|nr:hypothetical protein [Phycisphaerales bacterium]
MGLSIPHLLIREERLRRAGILRIVVGLAASSLGLTACRQGWGGGTYTFVGSIMGGVLLCMFSSGAMRWRRERGLWMAYIAQACASVFMYTILLQAPSIPWPNAGSPPSIRPPNPRVVAEAWDAAIGGSLLLMNLRLQASAAVANFRRFRTIRSDGAGDP